MGQWRTVAPVGMSAHIGRLRAAVGHDLLLLPSVSVLPVDAAGRMLLVRRCNRSANMTFSWLQIR
jgi:hypothetical protein